MNRENVVGRVIDAIRQVQESSGRTAAGIGPDTRPFKDIEGFDSLSGIEATVLLSESLGRELPDSVFAPSNGDHILSVNAIAENLCQYVRSGGANR